jgi:predicted methyltransferase
MRIRQLAWGLGLVVCACSCGGRGASSSPGDSIGKRPNGVPSWDVSGELDPIHAAVTAERDPEDTARDPIRRPEDLLRFSRIEPGMRVADLGTARGYTASLIARVVGIRGKVWAQNPPEWEEYSAAAWAERKANGRFPQLTVVQRSFDNPLPEDVTELDLVFSVLVYHDTAAMEADREAMNAAVFRALRPGGTYVVVDHHAPGSTGDTLAADLHRIERDLVIAEIEAAGFELIDEADFLRDPTDDRRSVAWRNPQPVTDRFVLAFEKPATAD